MALACGVALTRGVGGRGSPPGLPLAFRMVMVLACGVALTRGVGDRGKFALDGEFARSAGVLYPISAKFPRLLF